MHVQVNLEGKALEIVLNEQSKYAKDGKTRGKDKIINLLLAELTARRIYDTMVEPMSNEKWKKYLKTAK